MHLIKNVGVFLVLKPWGSPVTLQHTCKWPKLLATLCNFNHSNCCIMVLKGLTCSTVSYRQQLMASIVLNLTTFILSLLEWVSYTIYKCFLLLRSFTADYQPSSGLSAAESSDFPSRTDAWPPHSSSFSRRRCLPGSFPLPESRAHGWAAQPTLWYHGALSHLPSGQGSVLWHTGALFWQRAVVRWPGIRPPTEPTTQHQWKFLIFQARSCCRCRLWQKFLLQRTLRGRGTAWTCCSLWRWRVQFTVQRRAGWSPHGLWWTLTPWATNECSAKCHFPWFLRQQQSKDREPWQGKKTAHGGIICVLLSIYMLSFFPSFHPYVCIRL